MYTYTFSCPFQSSEMHISHVTLFLPQHSVFYSVGILRVSSTTEITDSVSKYAFLFTKFHAKVTGKIYLICKIFTELFRENIC
jgi:hypothetical protein